jgi:hypothetical protein
MTLKYKKSDEALRNDELMIDHTDDLAEVQMAQAVGCIHSFAPMLGYATRCPNCNRLVFGRAAQRRAATLAAMMPSDRMLAQSTELTRCASRS